MSLLDRLLDRTIASFFPALGARRAAARNRIGVIQNLGHFKGAGRGARGKDFRANNTDAVEAMRADHGRLSWIARDQIRNDPRAVRLTTLLVDLLVGKGIEWQVHAPSLTDDQRQKITDTLNDHLKTTAIDAEGRHTLGGLIALSVATAIVSGEILIRRRLRRAADGLPVPLQLQLLEGDYLDLEKDGDLAGGAYQIQGVEFDPIGRRRAYHLYRAHPGSRRFSRMRSSPVPAESVIHAYRSDRPGQVRGVSWFAPVLTLLHDLASYQDAQVKRQEIASMFAGILTATEGTAARDTEFGELSAGAVLELREGEEMDFTDPPSVEGYDQFMKTTLATVAGGMNLNYNAVAADYDGVSFSGGRMARLDTDAGIERLQSELVIGQICVPIGGWIKDALDPLLEVDPEKWSLKWTPPKRPVVDPARENAAEVEAVSGGIKSRRQVMRERGFDPEEVEAEIAAEREWEATNNIQFGKPAHTNRREDNTDE